MKNIVEINEKNERPNYLNLNFPTNYQQDDNSNFTIETYSENDNSPSAEMNSKKILDKPTLVSAFFSLSFVHGQFDAQCPMEFSCYSLSLFIRLNVSQWDY